MLLLRTTLRYKDEVKDPSHFAELKDLPKPVQEELAFFMKIVDKMTTNLDLNVFHDGYKERIEALIKSKMKGEVAQLQGDYLVNVSALCCLDNHKKVAWTIRKRRMD